VLFGDGLLRLGNGQLQHAVLKVCLDGAGIRVLREAEAALELSIRALDPVVPLVLGLLGMGPLTTQCKYTTVHIDGNIILGKAGQLRVDNVSIDVDGGVLTLSGERTHTEKTENERYHRIERSYGKFQRSFSLPESTDPSTIQANFENGVLELSIPKAEKPVPKKHRIAIQGGNSPSPSSPAEASSSSSPSAPSSNH